jgi:hypothetical protein
MVILWVHDLVGDVVALSGLSGLVLLRALLSFDRLVFVSEWQRLHFLREFAWNPTLLERSVAIHHFDTLEPLSTFARSSDVIHCAHPRKGLEEALEVFRALHELQPDISCSIVDSAAIYQTSTFLWRGRESNLREAIQDFFGCSPDWLEVLPAATPREHLERLRRFKVMIHPDRSIETGSRVCIEAMWAGVVPVVSDRGCLPEVVGGTGVTLHEVAGDAWARAVSWLVAEDRIRSSLAASARSRAQALFGTDRALAGWQGLLSSADTRIERCADAELGHVLTSDDFLLGRRVSRYRSWVKALKGTPTYRTGSSVTIGALEPVRVARDLSPCETVEVARALGAMRSSPNTVAVKILLDPSQSATSRLLAAVSAASIRLTAAPAFVVDYRSDGAPPIGGVAPAQRRASSAIRQVRRHVEIVRVDSESFPSFYKLYSEHVRTTDSLKMSRQALRRALLVDGCGGFGLLARSMRTRRLLGYALIVGQTQTAALHLWHCEAAVDHRERNTHKALIAAAIEEARTARYAHLDLGGDLRPFGAHTGLSHLYSLFGGRLGSYINAWIEPESIMPSGHPHYAVV